MKSKLLDQDGSSTWLLVFDTGEAVIQTLQRFAEAEHLDAAHFQAIGAFSDVVLKYFDWPSRQYRDIPIREQVEVLVLAGDIVDKDGKPAIHAHVVVGKSDGTAHGGHLGEAHVRPTLELILTETPAHLRKRLDARTGLSLISI